MPSAHSGDAYDLLEQSFNDVPLLKSHKNLPRRYNDSHSVFPSATPSDVTSFSDDETSNGLRSELPTPLASPPLIHRHGSGLPPTPPSALNDNGQQANYKPPQFADGVMSSLTSRRLLAVTPVNQRSPPTPDPSPPRTADRAAERTTMLERPHPIHYPSSRADSFKTAQENVDTSDDDASRSQLSFHDALTPTFARPQMEMPFALSAGLGLELDNDSTDLTPTQPNKSQDSYFGGSKEDIAIGTRGSDVDDIPNREWDTNLMRNVTVRRRRVPSAPAERGSSADPQTPSSTMKRGSSLRERLALDEKSPRSLELESFAKEIGWPTEVNNILNSHLRDPDSTSKRFSEASASSTVIEAVVVATPPQRPRALRHSGKNIALRQSGGSPSSGSNRTSVSSDDVPPHRLLHKRSRIPERGNRDSIFSDGDLTEMSTQSATPRWPHTANSELEVRKRRQSQRTPPTDRRSDGQSRSFTDPRQSRSHTVYDSNPRKGYFDVALSAPRSLSVASPPRTLRRQHQESPLTTRTNGLRHSTAPAVTEKSKDTVTLEYSPTSSQESSFRRSAPNYPVLNRKESLLSTPEERGFASTPLAAVEARHLLQEHPSDSPKRLRASLDRASTRTEEIIRSSIESPREERARISTESSPRLMSLDRSFMRMENEYSLARHHFAQTPFSQFSVSETGDPPQVSEATAVSIYPHNNNSLLVVQQVARTHQRNVSAPASLGSPTHGPPRLELPQPSVIVNPSTPPQQIITELNVVESPLKNPRKPPEPPVLKIIPATPAEELERQLEDTSGRDRGTLSERPIQRLTLVQRARRYSDTFIQPILRTASVRRITAPQRSPRRAPSVGSNPPADNNLHPFWKPRGFWDDFSSSDDDEALDPQDDPVGDYEHRRLPQGGDTSDVGEQNDQQRRRLSTLGRRLTDGFKGHGGFLIGNSLGLDRHGTNSRRHHVSVPVVATLASRRLHKKQSMHSLNTRASAGPSASASTVRRHSISPSERQRRTISTFSASTVEQPEGSVRGRGAAEREKQKQLKQKQQQKRLGGGGLAAGSDKREYRIPGGWKVEYVGLRGMRERIRERRAEKRRERLRRNIGQRFYLDSTGIVV
ncbi:hypothetical protein K490DRAFT_62977 [Saccharata proteae CBS 121410]|uniref:Uncharacterized protein n=1 Tax=Saccharata proteae CBS 121410 TaxID=1314787 RepID=A0A9P4LYN7_9PEZI|nr:hypothetical protein K490DRAFT_62977 [Saccharata proteae CBS 121410]